MATGKKNAARLKASLVFLDEAGFLMAPLVRRTWAPRGQTPLLHQRTRSHRKVSAIGALAVSPRRKRVRCYFRLHPDTNINGDLLVCFLRQLVKQLDTPILLVWDRLKAHRGRTMTGYLHATPTVRAVLLPAYAPRTEPDRVPLGLRQDQSPGQSARRWIWRRSPPIRVRPPVPFNAINLC